MKDFNNIPNSVLRAFEPFLKTKSELYELKNIPEAYLNFEGIENLSDCYFKVTQYKSENGKFLVTITQKPKDSNSVDERTFNSGIDDIKTHLSRWTGLIEERKRLQEVFSVNSRTSDIENEFFEQSPFSEIDFDNEYFSISEATELSNVCISLIEYVASTDAIKNKDEIIEEINFLEENSTQESKRKLAQRFAKIKALMLKNGPKVLKAVSDIGVNIAGNVIAKMITG